MKHYALFLLFFASAATVAEPIAATSVQYREVAQTWSVDGVVEAARQSTMSAQINGRVKEVYFDVGDRVKKGQIILRIDEREAAQAVLGSQAQVLQAQVAMQKAKADYERAQQLFSQKFISQAALDKAQADYRMALAQAASSEAGAEQSALVKGYTAVVAPYSGVVSARLVEVGEMVTVGKPLMTGFDPAQMRVVADVPQYRLSDIGTRPQAVIDIPSLNRQITPASLEVLPTADTRTHSTQVRVNLEADESGIYPGMFVRVQFIVGRAKKLLIPASAVLRRSEVTAVYVLDKGVARLRQVRLGESSGQEIEVLAGLIEGEQVALDPVKAGMAK